MVGARSSHCFVFPHLHARSAIAGWTKTLTRGRGGREGTRMIRCMPSLCAGEARLSECEARTRARRLFPVFAFGPRHSLWRPAVAGREPLRFSIRKFLSSFLPSSCNGFPSVQMPAKPLLPPPSSVSSFFAKQNRRTRGACRSMAETATSGSTRRRASWSAARAKSASALRRDRRVVHQLEVAAAAVQRREPRVRPSAAETDRACA